MERWDKARIVVQSLKSGRRTTIIDGGSDARYVPTGHLLYAIGGTVYGVAFDPRRMQVKGAAIPVIEGVRRSGGSVTGAANFDVSRTGSVVYIPGPASAGAALLEVALADRKGAIEPLNLPPAPYAWPRVSGDGKRLAVTTDDAKEAIIWTYELSGARARQRLTFGGNNRFPVWSPDGKRIVFQSDRGGDLALYWQPADGTGSAERLTKPEPGTSHTPESWSPKGDVILFRSSIGPEGSLRTLSLADQKIAPFGGVRSSDPTDAVFSPDGRWVAYGRTDQGVTRIEVQPFPATGATYQLSAAGSPHHPVWSPDTKEIFYNPAAARFEVVSVTTKPTFAFGNAVAVPKVLLMGPPALRRAYDITPDGRLVGLVNPGDASGSTNQQLSVVLNWFEELKARVPNR